MNQNRILEINLFEQFLESQAAIEMSDNMHEVLKNELNKNTIMLRQALREGNSQLIFQLKTQRDELKSSLIEHLEQLLEKSTQIKQSA